MSCKSLNMGIRGQTNPNLFSDVETVLGDRKKDLSKLANREFDAVLDTGGYFPENVAFVAERLKESVGQYVFISSCSVFDHHNKSVDNFDEDGPLVDLEINVNDESSVRFFLGKKNSLF